MINVYSCSSQEKNKTNITGNWFNYENTSSKNIDYVESFISKDSIYYYNNFVGLTSTSHSYIIENRVLYYVHKEEKIKSGIIKIIDDNTLSLNRKNGHIILKRIVGTGVKLEDFLFKRMSEDKYWGDFNKRKTVWEKSKKG